ncbi:MAG: class I SAM-dependent methyltransferase [Acidimicrobiia bacterium]
MTSSDPVRSNRRYWEREAAAYQADHSKGLMRSPMAWGIWRIPESQLRALGDIRGCDVLEYGCGGAQWSIALRSHGARVVGLDIAMGQLSHARSLSTDVALVQASGDATPFADGAFDVVFCDHGAMGFIDPRRTLPEVRRLLRPGGRLAFSLTSPLRFMCADDDWQITETLQRGYFDLWQIDDPVDDDAGSVDFSPTHGQWIELLRDHGFTVDALHELRPRARARTTYDWFVPLAWARKWPAEDLWVARRT